MAIEFIPDDHVDFGQWDVSGDTMSISLWVNLNSNSTDGRLIMKGVGIGGSDHYWGMAMNGGNERPQFRIFASAAMSLVEASTVFTFGVWYHVVGTYDGTTMRIYVNGVEENSVGKTGDVRTGAVDIWSGDQPGDPGSRQVDGKLEDVRVYDRVLTPGEISTMYVARGVDNIVRGAISRWIMNGGAPGVTVPAASGTVKDVIGSNHGTQTGAPLYAAGTIRTRRRSG